MPQRLIHYSRTEPARTILGVIVTVSMIMQVFVTLPLEGLSTLAVHAPNVAIVLGLGSYTMWAVIKNKLKHMSTGAFWWQLVWSVSTINNIVVLSASSLLWVPFLVVTLTLSVIYLYLRYEYSKTLAGGVNE